MSWLRRRRGATPKAHDAGEADALLVARARDDLDAFAPLYDRYFAPVYRYCLDELRDPVAAEDAASQTFLRVLSALPTYRESGRFRAWLFALAHNAGMGNRSNLPWPSAGR